MIEMLPQTRKDVLAFAVNGELTSDDYDQLRPEMDLRADQYDSFDLLVDLSSIDDVDPSVLRDELGFTKDYADSIGRMAVVSDDGWGRLAEFVGKPFGKVIGVEVEQFEERSVATAWLDADHSG